MGLRSKGEAVEGSGSQWTALWGLISGNGGRDTFHLDGAKHMPAEAACNSPALPRSLSKTTMT
jgi:hypothetical protein